MIYLKFFKAVSVTVVVHASPETLDRVALVGWMDWVGGFDAGRDAGTRRANSVSKPRPAGWPAGV